MPEHLSAAHRQLREQSQKFIQRALTQPKTAQLSPEQRQSIISVARELGLFGLTQPKEYGGLEGGPMALTVVRETLASANHPWARLALGPGPGALADAEGIVRSRYLDPLLRGEKRAAFAFTEPKDGSPHTRAQEQGDDFIVNGVKPYVTGGAEADFFTTLVEFENGSRGLLCIDRNAPGVNIIDRFNSMEGGDHVGIQFKDARVPKANLHGLPGAGMRAAMCQIGDTRLLMAAESCGLMLWTAAFVSNHLTQPHASGEPLANREGIRLRFADLRMDTFVARATLYRAARVAESGVNATNEVSMAKVFCTEALGRVADTAIQLCGGAALTRGHPLEELYRRVRSMRIAEGASDVLRLNIIKGHFDLKLGTL